MASAAMPFATLFDAFKQTPAAPKPEREPAPPPQPEPAPEVQAQAPSEAVQPDPEPEIQPEPQSECPSPAQPEPDPSAQPEPPLEQAAQPEPQTVAETVGPSLEDRVAKLESRPADAWLERRLRVFEHTLTELQGRQGEVEKNSSGASGLLEHTLAEVKQLILDADQRQREAMKSLRSAVVGVSSRMEGVEAAIRAIGGNPPDNFVPEPVPEPEPAKPIDSGNGARAEPQGANVSFLAAARTAARVAAEQPKSSQAGGMHIQHLLRKLTRTQLLMIGGVGLIVLFTTLAMVMSKSMARADAAESPQAFAASTMQHRNSPALRDSAPVDFAVGMKYLSGRGMPKNARMAAYWFGRAAKLGDARAAAQLGTMFRRGDGVQADAVKSLRWNAIAAAGGNRRAMYDLASAYAEGWGTAKDFAQAAGWYARAAQEGDVDSAFNLAVLYERGDGVPQDLTEAFAWYAVAAMEGDGQSAARAGVLETQLTPDQVSSAKRFVQAFKPVPMDPTANYSTGQLAEN